MVPLRSDARSVSIFYVLLYSSAVTPGGADRIGEVGAAARQPPRGTGTAAIEVTRTVTRPAEQKERSTGSPSIST